MSEQYSFYDGTAGADEQDAIAGGAFSGGNDAAMVSNATGEGSDDDYEVGIRLHETDEQMLARKMAELEGFTFDQAEDVRADISGKTAYIAACKQLDGGRGVVLSIPVESVLEKFDRDSMELNQAGLGDRGVRALSEALSINQNVTSLSLVGNSLTAAGCFYLCEMLVNNRNIRHLNLSDNQLGRHVSVSPEGGAGMMLAQLLGRNTTIVSLLLKGNQLGDVDATHICRALAEHRSVQELDLSHNSIKYRGAVEIATMMSNNTELLDLDLSWNQFSSLGSLVILNGSTGIGANNTIKTFKMSWNGIDDTAVDSLAKSIGGSVLEVVDISHNRITEKGADSIAKALRASGSSAAIIALNLNDNPLRDAGCANVLDSLRGNRSMKHISLLQTGFGEKAREAATQVSRERHELTIIAPAKIQLL